ncbi:SDR family oxidoreductase [Sphingomonas sp. CFBP 13720]|uniref:SDR family oxidoreductase n=1 Tax=Sphingomonas sp. CFBP 13720 TaxID=2775302 RepID=UPI0017812607|nr:SDR family oxidoreductase [Sphingomonas sp. CFBP 13720]MBD8678885.1 SDR family oxidoreductase [Sphingomonas sp. CFBP 13720]
MPPVTQAASEHVPLKGRKAIITGGTTGIGRAIAVLLASEGADVFICGRDPKHVDEALADIRAVGHGEGIAIDLAEADNNTRLFDAAEAAIGTPDIIVLNAAVAAGALSETSEADLRYAIAADFTAYLLGARIAAERMGDRGDVVFIGSMSAYVLGPGSTIYAGIKYGIQGFSQALRRELGPKGIRVSNVEPGKTGSDMQTPDISVDEQRERIEAETMLRAEDIAAGVRFILTQPRRSVVQQMTIAPRGEAGE